MSHFGHRHSYNRQHIVQAIIEKTRQEFQQSNKTPEELAKQREEERREYWANYRKGMVVMIAVILVMFGSIFALANKHGGGLYAEQFVTHGPH